MAPGRRRGGKGVKTKSELRLGDLVLAKVKGFPAWPAKVSRPEDWGRMPDPRKYFVQFFGTLEIAFVVPADIQPFTIESKNKLLARCQGKTVKFFAQAVNEISEEFEELQNKVSSGIRDDNNMQTVGSEGHSADGVVGESLEVNGNGGMDRKGPEVKLETKEPSVSLQKQDYVENQDDHCSMSPPLSLRKRNKFSSNYKDSPSVSSPSHHSLVKEEGPLDIKVKGKYSSDGLNELTNGHKPKLAIGSKKKSEGSHGSAVPNEPSGEVKQRKKLKKEKRHSENVDDELNSEELNDGISRKRLKAQNGREKQGSQTNEADKISKSSDTGHDANLIKAQSSRKNDSRSPNIFDGKVFKRLTSLGRKAEACRPLRVTISPDDATRSSDEDDIPPMKRLRRASETTYSSALISDKVRSPVMQLAMKRRSVRLCDDEDDDEESQKTPIHGGTTSKVCLVADSKKKPSVHGDDPLVFASKGQVDEKVQSDISPNKVQSLAADVSPAARQLNSEKLPPVEVKSVSVSPKKSPQSIGGSRASAELQSKYSNKGISRKKTPAGDNKSASTSDRSTSFLSKQASFGDKKKATPKSDLQINDSVPVVRTSTENITSVRERLTFGKDDKTSFAVDSKISDSATSMKHLIAAAQAKKRQAHLQNSHGNPFPFSIPDFDLPARDLGPTPTTLAFESSKTLQLDVQGSHPTSPFSNVHQMTSINQHENEEIEERRVSSGHRSSLSGGTEAAVARDAFEGMIETLSRTKESIARATRLAIDCAKYGLASEVVELLIQKLENEPSLHRRVDLFFLVDSITQCSHSQKGITGASYVSTVQAALPRLIGAAAPAGSGAQENRRQCHKVLRLWLERKILPESVLRRFLDDIGVVNDDTSIGISLRRPSRSERAIHDPIREMEGMVVDEYGSNTTFQLPGLLSAIVLEDEEEFEDILDTNLSKDVSDTSPSDHTPDAENPSLTPSDRRHCILEDVDGELEMEDVSANQKDERPSFTNGFASLEPNSDRTLESASNVSSEWLDGSPPLPPGSPPLTPPLPTSPPPSPPPLPSSPPPPLPPPSTHQNPFPQLFVGPPQPPMGPPPPHIGPPRPMGPPPPPPAGPHPPSVGPPPPMGPPPLPCQQLFPPQPPMVSHHMANFQGNQCNPMASNPPSGLSNGGYNSSRPIDYGQGDAYINRQQFLPGSAPFAQRPLPPSHFPYPNSVYPPYNFSDGQRRYDEQWRMQGGRSCSGPPYPHEGYFGPPLERPPANNVNFQPPAPNTMPPASQIPVHGVQMMPGRPDMPAVNWRPA